MRYKVDGLHLEYSVYGRGAPLLLIHGFPLSGEIWTETAAGLSGEWTCIVPDLRGHGRSEASDAAGIETFADDCVALLDHLGERRPVVVCGLSMGGIIALDLFRRHRARTRGLVLVDCRANPESPGGREQRESVAQSVLREGSGVLADQMVDKVFAPDADAALKQRWRERMAATDPRGVAAAARALANRPDSQPLLPQIDVPTLLAFGTEDQITPPDLAHAMHAQIPNARLELIPAAGHLPPVEQPQRFLQAIGGFLHTLPPLA